MLLYACCSHGPNNHGLGGVSRRNQRGGRAGRGDVGSLYIRPRASQGATKNGGAGRRTLGCTGSPGRCGVSVLLLPLPGRLPEEIGALPGDAGSEHQRLEVSICGRTSRTAEQHLTPTFAAGLDMPGASRAIVQECTCRDLDRAANSRRWHGQDGGHAASLSSSFRSASP